MAADRLLPHPFPFLAALVTVTALVASNPGEGVLLVNLVVPVGVSQLTALVGWAIGGLFVRDRTRQCLIAFVLTLLILTSGYLFGWMRDLAPTIAAADSFELTSVGLLSVGAIVIIRRLPPPGEAAPRFLNLLTALLVLLAVPALVDVARGTEPPPPKPSRLSLPEDTPRPDIYLVVLDAYSGLESLRDVYGHDNTPFHDSLRARGFRFPDRPRANYTKTFLSVGSMLNREYADELVRASAPSYRERRGAYRALEFNDTARDLKAFGYEFVYVGSSYPPMATNRLADNHSANVVSREFESVWVRMTAIMTAMRASCRILGCARQSAPFEPEDAAGTERRLDVLAGAVGRPGPKFVMAHLLLPHGPFRFAADCGHRPPAWTMGPGAVADSLVPGLYVDQVECTNRRILALVDRIRAVDASAVIILQSDHGYARFAGGMPPDLEFVAQDQVSERFDVFAAYAGPGTLADSMAAHRTPVNVFRTVFRVLWGFDEPPLTDRFYWSPTNRPMALVEVDVE